MDEYSTPISQIRPEMSEQGQNVNYSDMLQSMEQAPSSNEHVQAAPNFPPPPVVQSRNNMNPHHQQMHMMMNNEHPKEENNETTNIPDLQKDIMFILIPSIILYSIPVQNYILRTIPSLFRDDKPTIIGNIMNAGLIAFIFIALKNMKIKFN